MCRLARPIFIGCFFLFVSLQLTVAQTRPDTPILAVGVGVPLHIVLDHRVSYSKAGEKLEGSLSRPIYVLDQLVLPAGSKVLGRISQVRPISRKKRVDALVSGDFTPLKEPQVEFYAVVGEDGQETPIQSTVAVRDSTVVRMASSPEANGLWQTLKSDIKDLVSAQKRSMEDAVHKPHKMERLKNAALARLPYHPQVFEEGTHFVAELRAPLQLRRDSAATAAPSARLLTDTLLHARLTSDLTSATNKWGDAVDAVLTEPAFGPDHKLIFAEGTHLLGSITHAVPSKRWGRSGQLSFTFKQIELSSGEKMQMRGQLSAADADRSANLTIDEEGNSRARQPRAKQLVPLAVVLLAQSGAESDRDGINGSGVGAANNGVAAGGFGLVGRLLALSAGSRYIAYGIGYYGAGRSIYSGFIARGKDVVFPRNTQIDIKIGGR